MVSSIADTATGKALTELILSVRLMLSATSTTVLQVALSSNWFNWGASPVLGGDVHNMEGTRKICMEKELSYAWQKELLDKRYLKHYGPPPIK